MARRKIDVSLFVNNVPSDKINFWVWKSTRLFYENPLKYIEQVSNIYPFEMSEQIQLYDEDEIEKAHADRNDEKLIEKLIEHERFPYDEPMWYILRHFIINKEHIRTYINSPQIKRILKNIYSMTAQEVIEKLKSPPSLNVQIGPSFRNWLRKNFNVIDSIEEFEMKKDDIYILGNSEEEGKRFVIERLKQNLNKRPDLIANIKGVFVIGEAKWIGQPGGNQAKQVDEVIRFCKDQRGNIRRIGIIDGFPWALFKTNNKIVNNKEAIMVQESKYDILSALLLDEYFQNLKNKY